MNIGPEPSRKSTYSLPLTSQTRPPRPSRITMSPAQVAEAAGRQHALRQLDQCLFFVAAGPFAIVVTPLDNAMPCARRRDRQSPTRTVSTVSDHEAHRAVEDPARHAIVHEPAAQHRSDGAADVEAGGDDAEHAAGHAGRCRCAHQHVARGHDHAGEEARRRHRRQQQHHAEVDRADREGDARPPSPKPAAATSAWRRVASATKPPASTPIAVAIR